MSVAWFLSPSRTVVFPLGRYCAMDEFTPDISADGGAWSESEVLGDQYIVKVRAGAATLTRIGQTLGFTRLPLARLDDSLATLNQSQRNAIRQKLLDAGYSPSELSARFPNGLGNVTLRDALNFLASRRLAARIDNTTGAIVLDGEFLSCRPLAQVDAEVSDI